MPYQVLIVDDEPHILSTLNRILSEYFTITKASSGQEALEILKEKGPFAAIISDYRMPGMNGIEFFALVKRRAPSSVRIMLTGYANVDMAIEAINSAGIFYFLSKPFNTEELLHITAYAVEKYRREDAILAEKDDWGSIEGVSLENVKDENKKEYLEGLLLINQGQVFWSEKDFLSALMILKRSLKIFSEISSPFELARASFYIASILLERRGEQGIKATDREILSLISQGIVALNNCDKKVFLQLERELLFFLLEWAEGVDYSCDSIYALKKELGEAHLTYPLAVYTLGRFKVLRYGKEISSKSWRNPKVQEIFLYLLAHRYKKVEKELLYELFWPEMEKNKVANNLSTILYYLRKGLQPNLAKPSQSKVVRFEGGYCWLEKGEEALWVDADAFLKGLEQAQSLKTKSHQRAISAYNDALSMYKGGFLEDFLYHEWLVSERDYLRVKWEQAIFDQTELLMEENLYEEASYLLNQAIHLEPWQEGFYQKLIYALMILGKQAEALKQYHKCCQILKEELDIYPSEKTMKLVENLSP